MVEKEEEKGNKKMAKKNVSLNIDEMLWRELKSACALQGTNIKHFLIGVIKEKIDLYKQTQEKKDSV